jgi:hypothetical protein
MPVVVVGTEKTFTALRPRLFEGKVSSRQAADVKAALKEANPHVNLDKLTPGTVLSVPDAPGVHLRPGLSLDEPTKGAVEGAAGVGRLALDELVQTAARGESEARAERKRVLKSLDQAGEAVTRTREPGLAKELEAARRDLEEEDERAKERAATLKRAQVEWAEGLETLQRLLG